MAKRNKSNGLPVKKLQEKIVNILGEAVTSNSDVSVKPLFIEIDKPKPYKFRIYVFNCSNPPGGRPLDEYKIVLSVGQKPGQAGNFDYSKGCFAIVLGYVNSLDVFVLWDATKHKDFAYNKNMQVKSETILHALATPLSFQQRKTKNGTETIIAARSQYLIEALNKRIELLYQEMVGRL